MPYLGVLGSNFEKIYSHLKSASSNLCKSETSCNNKNTSKVWDEEYFIGVFLGWNLKKDIVIFAITPSNSSKSKVLRKNEYPEILDQKCLIWVVWIAISKNYCHTSSQRPRICLLAKFGAKNENP